MTNTFSLPGEIKKLKEIQRKRLRVFLQVLERLSGGNSPEERVRLNPYLIREKKRMMGEEII